MISPSPHRLELSSHGSMFQQLQVRLWRRGVRVCGAPLLLVLISCSLLVLLFSFRTAMPASLAAGDRGLPSTNAQQRQTAAQHAHTAGDPRTMANNEHYGRNASATFSVGTRENTVAAGEVHGGMAKAANVGVSPAESESAGVHLSSAQSESAGVRLSSEESESASVSLSTTASGSIRTEAAPQQAGKSSVNTVAEFSEETQYNPDSTSAGRSASQPEAVSSSTGQKPVAVSTGEVAFAADSANTELAAADDVTAIKQANINDGAVIQPASVVGGAVIKPASVVGGTPVKPIITQHKPLPPDVHTDRAEEGVAASGSMVSALRQLVMGGLVGNVQHRQHNRLPAAEADAAGSLPPEPGINPKSRAQMPRELLVHLDLKGAPPRLSYLQKWISLAASQGATGLLIEWEDKFPYWGPLAAITAGTAYTREEASAILDMARQHNLTVMPLVQTFGHLEFVLKLPQFAHLREDPRTPQALCPSQNESFSLVRTMIDQLMQLHGNVSRLHIGSDEVFVLGKCSKCRQHSRHNLFLAHVSQTARYVRERYNAIPVMWEDMLRQMPSAAVQSYGVNTLVEPMLWWYTPKVRTHIASYVWRNVEKLYPYVWGAGAFKGAFGSSLLAAPIDQHVQNNLDWADLLAEEDRRLQGAARGLVLTGWSRYDHMATPAELLPAAVPSLVFSLAAIRHGALDEQATTEAQRALGCRVNLPLSHLQMPFMYSQMARCSFPGHGIYSLMNRLNQTYSYVRDYLAVLDNGHESSFLGDYSAQHGFFSLVHLRRQIPELEMRTAQLKSILAPLYRALVALYPTHLVLEWLEYRVYPLLERLTEVRARWNAFLALNQTFPVRPLQNYPNNFIKYMDENVYRWRASLPENSTIRVV